jgi:uncharacterized protein (DUF736 family)
MAQIGQFTRTETGFSGRLRTLSLDVALVLVPAEPSDADRAPDYRIYCETDDGGPEVGAAWKRTGQKAGDYLSFAIDDPSLARSIHGNLFQSEADDAIWALHWTRPPRRGERD